MKTAFALFAVLFIFTSTLALRTPKGSNQDILQQLYNGFFEQAGLPDPVTIVNCYDDDSAMLTVNFFGTALQYMADLDALAVHRAVKNFEAQAPQALKDCLASNAEMETAQKAYGLPSFNLDQLTTRFEYYALDHVNAFKSFANQANNDYQSANYNTVGQEGGAFTAQVFKKAQKNLRSDRDTLQQVFNGFWEQAGLTDPQTAVSCFDDNSATQAVNALGNSLSQLANNNVAGAEKTITDFVNSLPQSVKDCLGANSEVQSMLSAYHIAGLTPAQVQQKLAKFLLTHIFSLHKDAVQANSNFQSGNYKPVGTEGGVIAQQVFGNGKKLRSDADTLQGIFTGAFNQVGLTVPTTVVACFDSNSQTLTNSALGTVLDSVSHADFVTAGNTMRNYFASLPSSVTDCLQQNGEYIQFLRKYHLSTLTNTQFQAKVAEYTVLHRQQLVTLDNIANQYWINAKFASAGQQIGVVLQQIFGSSSSKNLRSDRDTLQQVFNGFWEQAGLADPQTAASCFDDNSATQAVNALGTSLSQLANNNVAGAEKTITDFVNTLPQSVKDCLGANSEVQSMLSAYHISGLTPAQVQQKLAKFLLTHIFSLHKDAVQANSNFQSGNYKPVGTEGGVIAQQVFGNGKKVSNLKDAKSTLQLLNNGFYEQAGLPDPVTILNCYDDDTAQLTVNFIGTVLQQMADNQVVAIEKTIKAFQAQAPQSLKDCLNSNAEIQTVQRAYGFYGMTLDQIQNKIETYAFSHLIAFKKASIQANNDFKAGNFVTVGQEGGQMAQQVFAQKNLRSDRDTLQQVFNGFWEQAGLADPQTAVSCFDDNSATQAVNALGNSLSQLANNNVAGAEKTITDFVNSLPQSVKDCLGANSEVQSMLSAYHISGLTPAQVQQKLAKFLLTHIFSLHKDAVQANSNFQSGNYKPVGTEGGVIAQQVFGNGKKVSHFKDAESTLQLMYNGYFEQAGLADPTTILSCYDDDTAQLTVNFIGTVLVQMANNMLVAIEKTLKAYQAQVPPQVKDCLRSNAELQEVENTYGYSNLTLLLIQARIEAYAVNHYAAFHAASIQANNDFKFGNFKTVGVDGGQLAHQVFSNKNTRKNLRSDRDTLQQVFNGFWEQAGLADPQTAVSCFDDNSATQAVNALGNSLSQLANNNVAGAEKTITDFVNSLPQSVKDCLGANSEVQSMLSAYHISGLTPAQVQQKLAKFLLTHIFSLHKDAVQANSNFQSGNYKPVGTEGGVIAQQVFGNGKKLRSDADTLQGIFTGAFNQVGLTVPTTVVSCFDSNSQTLTNSALGTVLDSVSRADFVTAGNTMRNYFASLPSSVTDCLQQNGEYIQFLRKYHLATLTTTQFQAKVAEYTVLHRQQLITLDNIANQYWINTKFASAGQQIGVVLQQIFGSSTLKDQDPKDTLQQYLNGYFEYAKLDDPTTIISSCFNDDTALLVANLIASLVDELANNKILVAEKTALDFIKTCPPALKACVLSNPEAIEVIKAYGLNTYTPPTAVAKVVAYALTHASQFTGTMVTADQAIQIGEYASAGQVFGQVTQMVFGKSSAEKYFRGRF